MAYNILQPLYAAPARSMVGGVSTPVAAVAIPVSTTVVSGSSAGFTSQTPVTELVMFDVQTNPVRVRFDGTDPEATVGTILPVNTGAPYVWSLALFNSAKFIRVSADATIFANPLQT